MIIKANFREALTSLTGAKQRTILALIGIVIGIGSVIGMVSIGNIVQNEALKQFKDMGIDIITVRSEGSGGKNQGLQLDDILKLKGYRQIISEVAPYLSSGSEYGRNGAKIFIEQMGVTESFFEINKLRLREGRMITDLDAYRYFCVIGMETAQFLRKNGFKPVLGEQITLGERIYTIVGILDRTAEGGMRPYGINTAAITHITTGARAFQNDQINVFMGRVTARATPQQIKSEIQGYFGAKSYQVRVSSAEELVASMQKQMRLFSLLLGAIGSISLIVGGIGVMNVMLISVSERRREIGLRRALGAQQADIQSQFIIEAVTLCLVGGIIGIVIGVGTSYIFAYFSKWQFIISLPAILLGFGVATAVGVFFGYYPARAASRLDPIKALRT